MGGEPASTVTTVLGSCVAVTLFSPGKFWAICHGVLPSRDYSVARAGESGHYVEEAIPAMLEQADIMRVLRSSLVAKLFGGSRIADITGYESIGELNVLAAEHQLAASGIELFAEDVGGTQGRKLVFVPQTGDVFVKRLGDSRATQKAGRI